MHIIYSDLAITNPLDSVKMEHKLDYLIVKMVIWIIKKLGKNKGIIYKYIQNIQIIH